MPHTEDRKPYRLVRGSYSRRDGNVKQTLDPDTGSKMGKTREFVQYRARTADEPNNRDEIMLTDNEARVLGARVRPLFRTEGQDHLGIDESRAVEPRSIEQLIAIGVSVNGTKTLREFREMVFKSGLILGVPIPQKKAEIIDLLRRTQTAAASEAKALGLEPLDKVGQ